MSNFRILSYDEELQLSLEARKKYYNNLQNYLLRTKYKDLNSSWIQFAEKLNKNIIRFIIDKIKGYELIVDGLENIPNSPVIYASTHQDFCDHFNAVLSIPEHAVILNTINVTPLFKFLMFFNGIIYVDRLTDNSRFDAKIEQMKCLAKGKSVVIFPEGTYNCSPNKLHLPLHKGVIDMARKMQVPIVPLIQEYTYDESISTIKCVKSCHVRFGKPIYVDITDNIEEKLSELSENFSTIRFELIAEKGNFKICSNMEYINYVLSRIDAWSKVKVNIDDERKTIYKNNDEFYLFHHINDVDFDEFGNLLETKLVRQLNEICSQHLGIITNRDGLLIDTEEILKLTRNK